jgi:hypothetical protein
LEFELCQACGAGISPLKWIEFCNAAAQEANGSSAPLSNLLQLGLGCGVFIIAYYYNRSGVANSLSLSNFQKVENGQVSAVQYTL